MSYHPAKFDDHRHSGSRDMIFVCHVNLQAHVIRAFRGHRNCGSGDIMVLACHVTS